MKVAILSASVRRGRQSHSVARFFQNYLRENRSAEVDMIDLAELRFPIFEERLQYLSDPSSELKDYAARIVAADGVLIVTPEYNGGYPAALKNAIDVLYPEWKHKPVAIAAVSDGPFGANQVVTSLVFSLFKIGVLLVPARFHVARVQDHYAEDGTPVDATAALKVAKPFIDELFWVMEARGHMNAQ